jgi:hypothetical protein
MQNAMLPRRAFVNLSASYVAQGSGLLYRRTPFGSLPAVRVSVMDCGSPLPLSNPAKGVSPEQNKVHFS